MECPISQEEIKNKCELKCGHIFEEEHIKLWLNNNKPVLFAVAVHL